MKAELINNLEKCPEKCDDLLLAIDDITLFSGTRDDNPRIFIDCAHSGVCRYRDKGNNDD